MAKAFYFDMTRCIGCKTCQIACKDKNDLPIGTIFREISSYEGGEFPALEVFHYSASCNHCADPACVANCPTGAMYKTEDGPVLHDDDVCIGCGMCVQSCPYGVPKLIEAKGISGKCDTCIAIRNNGGEPQCVAACPMRALDFGEYDELLDKYPDAVSINVLPFLPASETGPMTLVKVKDCALNADMMKMDY